MRGNIVDAVSYILDIKNGQEKTEGGIFQCNSEGNTSSLFNSFVWKSRHLHRPMEKVGYHLQFSLPVGEGNADDCLMLAEEWIKTISNNKAKYVIAVHTNTHSIHAHIICDLYDNDGKEWIIFWKRDKNRFRAAADRICKQHGFSVLEETKAKGQHYFEYMNDKTDSNRDFLKKILDDAIPRVASYDDLKDYLDSLGFRVYDNKSVVDENNFIFTADKKALNIEKVGDDSYQIRIPGKSERVQVDAENLVWLKENKTARISIPVDKTVSLYSSNGEYLEDVSVSLLKKDFEEKHKDKRSGLRIRVPDSKRVIRTDRLDRNDNGEGYSFDEILERIKNNGVAFTDSTIKDVIQNRNDFKKNMDARTQIFERAGVKLERTSSTLYKSVKQERYYKWKAESVMRQMDKMSYNALLEQDRNNINLLKNRRNVLQDEINKVNESLSEIDESLNSLSQQRIEGIIQISDEEVEKYIDENRNPLVEQKAKLQEMIRLYSERINKAEESEQKKEKEKSVIEH